MEPSLAAQIAAELADERFLNRLHGKRSGANAGCKGPLCRKFTRDRIRELYRKRHEPKRVRRGPVNPEVDRFLDQVIQAHADSRKLAS